MSDGRRHDRRAGPADAPARAPRPYPRLSTAAAATRAAAACPSREQDQAERRRDRQRDQHRHQHRQPVGEHERPEERARQALQEEDRDDRHDVDHRRVGDRAAHLDRGVEHDPERRDVAALGARLAQASDDVLDVDDRVVDHHPDRDHQPGQDHHVDASCRRRSSTRIAAISDSGIAIRLMNAVRHSNRNAAMMRITSSDADQQRRVRLSIDCSMNVAGRKIVVSISMPGRPGRSSAIASSTPSRDLHACWPRGTSGRSASGRGRR